MFFFNLEADSLFYCNVIREDKTPQSQDEANADNIGLDVEATNKENQKKTNNELVLLVY